MSQPIVRPKGRFQELVLVGQRQEKLRANPHLVFAVADTPHSPKPVIPGVTQWVPYAAYRLREDAVSEGILHPAPSAALEDYISMKTARTDALESLLRIPKEDADMSDPIFYLTRYLMNVPDVTLTPEPRFLPRGSLLLCESRRGLDGLSDVWVSYTPEEQTAHGDMLQRGCGMVMQTGEKFLSLRAGFADSANPGMSMWPRANRVAHRVDMAFLQSLKPA